MLSLQNQVINDFFKELEKSQWGTQLETMRIPDVGVVKLVRYHPIYDRDKAPLDAIRLWELPPQRVEGVIKDAIIALFLLNSSFSLQESSESSIVKISIEPFRVHR